MLTRLRRLVDAIAFSFGYVSMDKLSLSISTYTENIDSLQKQNKLLLSVIPENSCLEQEINRLLKMHEDHTNNNRGIQIAVQEMERITEGLMTMMHNISANLSGENKIIESDVTETEDTKEL